MNTSAAGRAGTNGTAETPASSPFRAVGMLRGFGWDVGLPLVAYYGLHLLGVSDWTALLAVTVLAGARIVWSMLRDRTLNVFATVMLVVFGLGMLLALVSGDARFILLKDSIVTAGVALVFLVTTVAGRPLTLSAMKSFQPDRAAEIDEQYRTIPGVRRVYGLNSAVWGGGLLLEALVRVPLIYALPISVMVGLSGVLTVVTFGVLIAWTVWYTRHSVRRLRRG